MAGGAQGWHFPLSQLPHGASSALSPLLLTQEKMRLFLDKKCQYLPFQDWSVKCKKMVDTGMLVLVQLGKQVLVTGGDTPLKPWFGMSGGSRRLGQNLCELGMETTQRGAWRWGSPKPPPSAPAVKPQGGVWDHQAVPAPGKPHGGPEVPEATTSPRGPRSGLCRRGRPLHRQRAAAAPSPGPASPRGAGTVARAGMPLVLLTGEIAQLIMKQKNH